MLVKCLVRFQEMLRNAFHTKKGYDIEAFFERSYGISCMEIDMDSVMDPIVLLKLGSKYGEMTYKKGIYLYFIKIT